MLLSLSLRKSLRMINTLAAGGACIVELSMSDLYGSTPQRLPAALARLSQLSQLALHGSFLEGSWQHLPRQLHQLDLACCCLRQVPTALALAAAA